MLARRERSALSLRPPRFRNAPEPRKEKWRLLLPGASGPRLAELNPSGL